MARLRLVLAGIGLTVGCQALIRRLLLRQFRHSVDSLNRGDYRPLLDGFADDAVLHFNDAPHRWAGEHRGRDQIEIFLQDFVAAGLQGEIREFWTSGPPWALTAVARFDDHATGAGGEELYSNQTMIMVRTRWGKVTEQRDFYVDTGRMIDFDRKLTEMGIDSVR
ncbi:MAG: nuclear transport factor 2 family protein [Solirubrobacterales bacterium]|nr:nuclear transport factor 2 family protein [Solirubrobacterales bacterium]